MELGPFVFTSVILHFTKGLEFYLADNTTKNNSKIWKKIVHHENFQHDWPWRKWGI